MSQILETLNSGSEQPIPKTRNKHLRQYSMSGRSHEISTMAESMIPLVGDVIVTGQCSVIYAAPNTGKTLLTLRLLADSIREGRVSGSNVYYVNVDDNLTGVKEKLAFAEENGFEMLVEGHQNFTAPKLAGLIQATIDDRTAKNQVVVLDTLKKFTDLMSKSQSSEFADLSRRFVMSGGTLIALAHTNKNPSSNGRPQYSGTNDIHSDFDCAVYLLDMGVEKDSGRRFVRFDNFKTRGGVEVASTYSYKVGDKMSYRDLLNSVQLLSEEDVRKVEETRQKEADEDLICVVCDCIQVGKRDKTTLLKEVRTQAGVSRENVESILKRYEGKKYGEHLWYWTRGEHGRKTYSLVTDPSAHHPDF